MLRTTPIGAVLFLLALWNVSMPAAGQGAEPFPGTAPLEFEGDLASEMVAGIDRFLSREIAASVGRRSGLWNRDTSSREAYVASIEENRRRLATSLGAVDPRVPAGGMRLVATTDQPALVGRGENFQVFAVEWPALAGVHGEGLLLVPTGREPIADIVAIPDADQTPEMLAGLTPGIAPESQFARRLAESGCRVVIPTLIDRGNEYSVGAGGARRSNEPHRELVYRPAYEMGRHIIGYEVQKVLAAVDWIVHDAAAHHAGGRDPRIGVIGYDEGGLLALDAGALDPRIDVVVTSGYFQSRENVWQEPIYRNVWGLLAEFGDAELASLVAPRTLLVEASRVPTIEQPPLEPDNPNRRIATPGVWSTPRLEDVSREFVRAKELVEGLVPAPHFELFTEGDGSGEPGRSETLAALLAALGAEAKLAPLGSSPTHLRTEFDPAPRLKRQLDELNEFTQSLVRESPYVREALWQGADRASRSPERWAETTTELRRIFYDEVIGRFDVPLVPPHARSRKVYDEAKYVGYDVVLDVFPDVIAYGVLLVPKNLKPGERRPVVVCQHGLEGRPQDVAQLGVDSRAYHDFACHLAERGFITYAPQNPYIFYDRFRTLQRKANPLRKTLFSVIVPQHQQTVDWLASLPIVDPERIGFYGLSYGGKSAMRIPALVDRYCLSICSGDFNEWIWKNTSLRDSHTYVFTREYEMFEFNLGNTFNYAEMAGLIAPRPFMVERGHLDGVAPDEWVAYEYAKVRRLYDELQIPERTAIEFFYGPHMINGQGTFAFLHEQLRWPEPRGE